VKVTFVNASGLHVCLINIRDNLCQESGIDGGGLFKEFIDDLMKEMSQERWGFFRATHDHRLVPNSAVLISLLTFGHVSRLDLIPLKIFNFMPCLEAFLAKQSMKRFLWSQSLLGCS
jgi:hypothetical protein